MVDDSYTEGLDNRGTLRGTSDNETYNFTYNLRTPLKGSFGASYVIANTAIISGDVDFVDYSSTKFSSSEGNSDGDVISSNNTDVRNNYKSAMNYRVGAEIKLITVSIRGGYGINGSPYKTDEDELFKTKILSAGLGYRVKNYFFDIAYQQIDNENSTLSPYSLNNETEPVATLNSKKTNVFLTFGVRF